MVVDCANGAAYKVAPTALWELGAEVFTIGVEPDGFNINDKVGSTAPEALIAKVRELRADIGIALDGDADRVIIVDEKGEIVDGDQFMAVIAQSWHARGELKGGGLVATVMSNLGLERYLGGIGLSLERTQVGDRYVLETMRAKGFNVGGEQSGHIILTDFTTTGDGLDRRPAAAGRGQAGGQAGVRGVPALRQGAAAAAIGALQGRASRSSTSWCCRRSRKARPASALTGRLVISPLGHRAGHPRDGRERRRGAGCFCRQRDRRDHQEGGLAAAGTQREEHPPPCPSPARGATCARKSSSH